MKWIRFIWLAALLVSTVFCTRTAPQTETGPSQIAILSASPAVTSIGLSQGTETPQLDLCRDCDITVTRASAVMTAVATPHPTLSDQPASVRPTVRAVMFWINGCPECHQVLDDVLPAIQAKFGEQFQIQLIELVSGQEVTALFELADSMGIAKESVEVPFLIIGDHALIGSEQIPAELSGLIEHYLETGGVDLPSLPALAPLLPTEVVEDHDE